MPGAAAILIGAKAAEVVEALQGDGALVRSYFSGVLPASFRIAKDHRVNFAEKSNHWNWPE